jgi:uncharacterized protein with von Willebrand factor type A (vWA) domain
VFTTPPPGTGTRLLLGTRPPTPAERQAARALARHLDTVLPADRVPIRRTSITPPGRLSMRGALAADAQRAAGATPTAQPFTRRDRRISTPPLRIGICCDVSGSMRKYRSAIASAAWIVQAAAAGARCDADTGTVLFGPALQALTYPGAAPPAVQEFRCTGRTNYCAIAIAALDGALHLTHRGAARLLVVISDGDLTSTDRAASFAAVATIRAAGGALLWLSPKPDPPLPPGVTATPLTTDPDALLTAIRRGISRALTALR